MPLAAIEETYPPEDLLDEFHPANDTYFTQLRTLRGHAVRLSTSMHYRHVEIAKLRQQGRSNTEIAEAVRVTPQTVGNVLRRDDVQELSTVLGHIGMLIDGPNLELRKHMLWRIARRNEEPEPNVAISALKELNKLEGAYPVQAAATAAVVNVTINGEALPRTKLDEEHPS